MGTGYQANRAQGTRSDKLRPDKVRHTLTMTAGLFETMRTAALAHNRSISEEMVFRLGASVIPIPTGGQMLHGECKALADDVSAALGKVGAGG